MILCSVELHVKPKSVIRISLCRTAKRNPNDRFGIKALVKPALTTKINDREMFMKGIDHSFYYEQE